ncbi:hypothetical protein Pf1_00278 [Flavobacterium columnare]|nr:hypothetical protein Pf1_00278 [Flavobacterium columnare]
MDLKKYLGKKPLEFFRISRLQEIPFYETIKGLSTTSF